MSTWDLIRIKCFPRVHWKAYEAIFALLQEFWLKQQNVGMIADYQNYRRFLACLKDRLTRWKEKEKFRPVLPSYFIHRLKEMKRIRKKHYHGKRLGDITEETRVLVRVLKREAKVEINKYKSSKWQEFLSKVQESHDNTERNFWLHLSKVYKHRALPFSKVDTGNIVLTKDNEIRDELCRYCSEPFKAQNTDISDPNQTEIETKYLQVINRLSKSKEKIEMTNALEIKKNISQIKPKKSSGFGAVSNFMIKRIPPSYISCLVNCFNIWLSEYRYLDIWKLAKMMTLNKIKAWIPHCDQTRPISLLATHSKSIIRTKSQGSLLFFELLLVGTG